MDSQSVKTTDLAEERGFDGGKKINGIKRHIIVDTNGLPLAIYITTANVGDRDGAVQMILLNKDKLCNVKKIIVDGGYTGWRNFFK